MFQGLRTAIYCASELASAKAWYSQVLGIEPSFDQPFYVGFNVGGYELGLQPDPDSRLQGLGGAVPYWGVDNAALAQERLVSLGAVTLSPVQDVGEGIRVAILQDPFGNALGIIENPHFKIP
jgi:predicted enzyme related to lactoylglutathione lyase